MRIGRKRAARRTARRRGKPHFREMGTAPARSVTWPGSYAFGIRQAEKEEDPEFLHNFALTSARPGAWQQMPVFLYVSADRAPAAVDAALAFTHGDTFKPLPGYQVMGS